MVRIPLFFAAAALLLSVGTQAPGQSLLGPIPSKPAETAPKAPPPPAEEQLKWAGNQAETATRTLENFNREAFENLLREADLPAEAAEEMEVFLTSIVRNYQSSVGTLEKVISIQKRLNEPEEPPEVPVDVAGVESLRAQAAELRNQISGQMAQIGLDEVFLAEKRQSLAEAKRARRLALEDMDTAVPSKKSSAALLVQLAETKVEANSSSVFLQAWRLHKDTLERELANLALQNISQALATSGLDTLFNRARAEAAIQSINEDRAQVEASLKIAKEDADRVASLLGSLVAQSENNSGDTIDELDLQAAREASTFADRTVRGYELWLAGLKVKEECWRAVLASLDQPEATTPLVKASQLADRIVSGLTPWSEHQGQEVQDLSSRLAQIERLPPPTNPREAEIQSTLLTAAKTRDRQLNQLAHEGDTVLQLASSLATESRQLLTERSLQAKLAGTWERAKSFASAVWQTELFTAEEKAIAPDGSSVVRERSISLGKLIMALLSAIAAVFLARAVAGRVGRNLRRRWGGGSTKIHFIEKGLFVLLITIIGLATLTWLHIPLTAFAFLGGAIAIGVGFGTQTIMSNFISGLILTAERRIRVGDIVEVDGITGSVLSLGTRCSTVRKFDGVEVLVPNSLLLEKSVANWNLSNSHRRFDFTVGIAYGSNTRAVLSLLEKCLAEQKEIMAEPAPVVAFEAFGESTLDFHLYYWLDIRVSNGLAVGTELRLRIDDRCREAGIEIAFPQRDVHLHSEHPLRVQLEENPTGPH